MLAADTPYAQNLIAPLGIHDPSTAPGGRVDYDDVLELVRTRLHVSETFRERLLTVPLDLDRPYWIRDADFDLEYHVRHLALPEPGDWAQLCTQVARIGARPLDLSRPPWELYVIDGLNSIDGLPEGCFATLLKMHHAAVDGVAGAQIVTALLEPVPDAPNPIVEDGWKADRPPTPAELLRRAAVNGLRRPLGAVTTLIPALREAGDSIRELRNPTIETITRLRTATRFNADIGPNRAWGSTMTSLADVKSIRAALNADGADIKINDIALGIVGGSLRNYLLDKDELPAESLIALMPISVRPTMTQKGSSNPSDAGGGNDFVMSAVSMETDVSDPIERVRRIAAATSRVKERGAHSAATLMELSQALPGRLTGTVQRAAVRAVNRTGRAVGVHTIVTNVPGPQVPMYFAGAKAVYMGGMAPVVDGMGLINAIGSYGGLMPICFTADREMLPDPDFYTHCLDSAVGDLIDRTRPATAPRREARRRGA
jgi:WS/DGAT/MGAT family acyltransferase